MTAQLIFLIWLVAAGVPSGRAQGPQNATECPEYDSVAYSDPRKDWPGGIDVQKGATRRVGSARRAKWYRSPKRTAAYALTEPDTSQPGPWTTWIEVTGNKARPLRLSIRVSDHVYAVRVNWLNEQLLWVQMWRGRIVSTDAILNVDTGKFIYSQDANYNSLIVPCSMKLKEPQ